MRYTGHYKHGKRHKHGTFYNENGQPDYKKYYEGTQCTYDKDQTFNNCDCTFCKNVKNQQQEVKKTESILIQQKMFLDRCMARRDDLDGSDISDDDDEYEDNTDTNDEDSDDGY